MQQQGDSGNISVTWRGKKFILKMNSSDTIKELGHKLQMLTNANSDTIRLIVPSNKSSKLLSPFTNEHSYLTLQEASIFQGKTVQMMGVPKDELDQILQDAKADLRIAGFDEEEKRLRHRMLDGPHTKLKLPQGTYIFCDFRTLHIPGIELTPPASEALKLMHTLAADPGITAIMNKHRWRVGIMTEMAPEGHVGVSPKCILGFNKNCGEEISLRLRTDDLKGFRKYESIKKTLLHELAHMVFSEHDANFHALDKQLNQEAATLDWTRSRSHTLSGVRQSQHYEEFYANNSRSSSQKLGGNISDQLANARASSVFAAYRRLANTSSNPSGPSDIHEEPDPDDSVLDIQHKTDHVVADEPDPDDSEIGEAMEFEPYTESSESRISAEPNPDESQINEPDPDNSQINEVLREEPDPDCSMKPNQGISVTQTDEPDPDDEELQRIRDPVTVICNRLQNAVEKLQSEVNPSETVTVLQTLFKIIRNVIEHPDEMKFRKLRKANPVIQRNIASHKAAMEILFLIGFIEDVMLDEIGKTETYLILKRNDPGLLWLAKSSLETCIAF